MITKNEIIEILNQDIRYKIECYYLEIYGHVIAKGMADKTIRDSAEAILDKIKEKDKELLLDQLYRFEGILGKYNCQHGGLECNFQTNCHRLIRAEIEVLRKDKNDT